jgi:hypothetical protein
LFAPLPLSTMSSSMSASFTGAGATAASITPPNHSTGVPVIYAPSLPMHPDDIVTIDENGDLMVETLQQPFRFSFPDLPVGDSAVNNGLWAHNPYLHQWLYPQADRDQSPLAIFTAPGPASGLSLNVECEPTRRLQPASGFQPSLLNTCADSGVGTCASPLIVD